MNQGPDPTRSPNRGAATDASAHAELLAAFAASTAHGVAFLDRDGVVEWVNEAFSRITGVDAGNAIGRPPADVLRWDTEDPEHGELINTAIGAHKRVHSEVRALNAHGDPIWLDAELHPSHDGVGAFTGWMMLLHDVTESVQVRERAIRSMNEVGVILKGLDEHSIMSVADTSGRILDVNEGFCRISGYSREELVGQDHSIINSGLHAKSFWVEMWRTIASGHAWRRDVCNRNKNGELYWVDSTVVPCMNESGEIERYISYRFDITAQKRAEHEVEEVEQRLRLFIEHTPVAIAMFDPEMRYLVASRGWYDQYGLEQSVTGRNHYEVFPTISEEWKRLHRRALAGEKLSEDRDPFEREDGSTDWVRWQIVPWYDVTGAVGGVLMVTEVITQQVEHERGIERARQDAEQANESLTATLDELERQTAVANAMAAEAQAASIAKSEFLANMSHEIRTPMTAILGYADLLDAEREGGLSGDTEDLPSVSDAIKRNADHLMHVINDILDVSKIEAGQMTIEHLDTDPSSVVADAVGIMHRSATEKGIALGFERGDRVPALVRTDPTRLRQIVLNLIGNAIKYTKEGSVRVLLTADDAPGEFSVRVADTGIGMSKPQLERITRFEAFMQADGSMSRRFGGTGLGLHISNAFASMLGGRIDAESELGQGSVFTLRLPAEIAAVTPDDRPQEAVPAVTLEDEPLAGLRLLLAEDGPDNQRLITFHLQRAGAEVSVANNGLEAIEAIGGAAEPFDAVLMDMQMPELDGYGATKRIRMLGNKTPILALTAHAMAGDREKCLKAGCDDYFTKPIDRAKLIEGILAWTRFRERRSAA